MEWDPPNFRIPILHNEEWISFKLSKEAHAISLGMRIGQKYP